jgi:inner membrane protease ATP23
VLTHSTIVQVILCHNRLSTYKEVELALAHELIHAYDFCRASNMDLTNCQHHACTEVRGGGGMCSCGYRLHVMLVLHVGRGLAPEHEPH